MLATITLTASQLVAKEKSASEVPIEFTLRREPALLHESDDIVLTLGLFPAHRTDVEKVQAEVDGSNLAAQKMDERNKEGALKHLRTVTEKITKVQGILDEASHVRDKICCFTQYLTVFADPSNRQGCLEDRVRGDRREWFYMGELFMDSLSKRGV